MTVAMSSVATTTLPVKAVDGTPQGGADLALKVATDTAKGLVHRYLVHVRQNARSGTASTLTRAEVRGGGRKPYNQKGTGNARRGSETSPLFPGGGVVFGPKPKDWSIKMNKKERRLALATALQSAAADIVVVEGLKDKLSTPKTKTLVETLENLGVSKDVYALVITAEADANLTLSARNVEKVKLNTANAIRVYDVLRADKIVIEKGALDFIQEFYGPQKAE